MKTYELTAEATLENLDLVNAFLEGHLEEAGCPYKVLMQIAVAAEEIYANIANYAYEPDTGMVTVRLELDDDLCGAGLTFTDSGMPFNPLEREDPDISLPAEERDIGGLGIYMVKKFMDELSYEFRDGQNIMSMRKRWQGGPAGKWPEELF